METKTQNVESKVKAILTERFGLTAEPTMDVRLKDMGADSLDAVEILMDCEKEFGVRIPEEVQENIETVGDIVRTFENKLLEL